MATVAEAECACAICALHLEFELNPHLLAEIERHNCVIFAGAGISTETQRTHPNTFYEQLKYESRCLDNRSFPQMVDYFEAQPNGRQKLIQMMVERFEYINSFGELKKNATNFHSEIATMPYFSTIITTNWDRYFEEEAGATPFVYESDVPFWESARRAVLKIHGSIDNYSSIVASTEDYERCARRLREGAIGAVLKQIFATKTCIFVGYSAKDEDFLEIYNGIRLGLGLLARTHFLISPFVADEDKARLEELNIISIKTDATYFLKIIKDHMVEKFCFARDEAFGLAAEWFFFARNEHFEFTNSYMAKDNPHLIFAAVYQDGLLHALQRILDLRHTGRYSDLHYIRSQILLYIEFVDEYRKKRDYWEISYFSGYLLAVCRA